MNSHSILTRSHLVNTTKLASYLTSSLTLDTECEFFYDPQNYSVSFRTFCSPLILSLVDKVNLAIHHFKSSFVIPIDFFHNDSENILFSCPNVLIILIEHSNIPLISRIKFIKNIFPATYSLSPFCWSICHRWYQALSFDDVHKDSMELMYSNPPYISHTSTEFWSPHIGVSFGHLSFLFEHLISIDFPTFSNSSVQASYLSPPSELTAYSDLPFAQIAASSAIPNFTIHDLSHSISSFRYLQLLCCSDSLTRAASLKRLDRHGYYNLCTLSSISSSHTTNSLQRIYAENLPTFSRFNNSLSDFLSTRFSHPQITNFLKSFPTFIVIHSRDSAYSGNSQSWRDSNFDNFELVVEYARTIGIGVIRLSLSANSTHIISDNFLDLSTINNVFLNDQLYLLKHASFVIGTGSGISHWHYLTSCPTLFINTVVMHVSAFTDSVLISPKRFTCNFKPLFDSPDLFSFATQWSTKLIQDLQPRELSPSELLAEVQYFIGPYTNHQCSRFTLHSALSQLGFHFDGIPDALITKDYYEFLVGT